MNVKCRFLSLAMVCVTAVVYAADFTWDGGGTDNNWLTDANWSPDGAPVADGSARLMFSGNARTAAVNNFTDDTVFTGITLLNDLSSGKTAGFTLSGNPITLGGNVVLVLPTVNGTLADTISLPMLLNGTRTLTMNSSGSGATLRTRNLTVSGAIGETGGSYGLIKTGGGNLTLNGASTYSGPTVMSGGSVYFNSIKNIGEGASALGAPTTVENGAITNSSRLFYTGGSTTTDRTIVLTSGFNWDVSNSGATLTLNGAIKSTNNSGPTFRGGGKFVVNGVIDIGSAGITRTDPGTVYLNCPTNPFTGNIQVSNGIISITNIANSGVACAIGRGNTINLGQNGWYTTGKLQFIGPIGGACNRAIRVETSTNTLAYGGILENTVAGQSLLLSGSVAPASASVTRNPRLQLAGAGNGELSGVISGSIIIDKNSGTGSWTLSGANTYTGATVVSAGTLLINGSTHADSAVSVSAAGTLGGTGTVNGAVSFVTGGTLAPGSGGIGTLTLAKAGSAALTLNANTLAVELGAVVGTCDRIDIAGELVLNGMNTCALSVGAAPAGTYTLMTYASRSGSGTLVLDSIDPNYRLTVGDTSVTLTIGGSAVTWIGDGSDNVWDTSTENWLDGSTPVTYGAGMAVIFDNTGSPSPAIAIAPDAVAPFSVTVDADLNAYTIGGAAITGLCGVTKTGTNLLVLSGANTYSGVTLVNAGTLELNGSLSNSSVSVAAGASLMQSAASVIAGPDASFITYGNSTLAGTNSYDGVTTVGLVGVSNITLTVNNNAGLGTTAGGVQVVGGTTANFNNNLTLASGITIKDKTLTLQSNTGRARLTYNTGSGSAMWDGDIVLAGGWNYLSSDASGGTLLVGDSAADTVTGVNRGINVRGNGTVIINSTLDLGTGEIVRDDFGSFILNDAAHVFGSMRLLQGTFKAGAPNVIPANVIMTIGKAGSAADAILDLNGMSQRVAGVIDERFAAGSGTQRILSTAPATLTVSNTTDCSFGLTGSSIEGAVSIVKEGSGTLTLKGANNSYSGATVVSNGTLTVLGVGTFGPNCTNIIVGGTGTLALSTSGAIADTATVKMPASSIATAKINLADGVNESVGWLFYGDAGKRAGTHGSTASAAIYKDDTHFSGTGVLAVLHANSGTLILMR